MGSSPARTKTTTSALSQLLEPLRLAHPQKRSLSDDCIVLGSALMMNLLALIMPLAVLKVYDAVIRNQAIETLAAIGLLLVAVAALEFMLRVAQSYIMTLTALRYGHSASAEAIDRELGEARLARRGVSAERRMEKFRALDALTDYLSGDHRRSLVDLPFSLVFLLALALIGGWIVFAPLLVIALAAICSSGLLRASRDAAEQRESSAERSAEFVAEAFGAASTVKALGAEGVMSRRYERLAAGTATHFRNSVITSSDLQSAIGAFTSISALATLGAGAILVMDGALSVGAMAACSMLAARAVQPILRGAAALAERQTALISADTCAVLFEGPRTAPSPIVSSAAADEQPAELLMTNVSLTINERPVLDEVTLMPPVGGVTLVEAGSAEHGLEILRLAAGLRAPEGGEVTVNGTPISEIRAHGAPGIISMITPSTHLFRGTVMENLTLFGSGAAVDEVLAAVEALGFDKHLNALPRGYATEVAAAEAGDGEIPQQLQCQIALARALAMRPRLLILDHPFMMFDSAEDAEQVLRRMQALRGQTTILVQSSRPEIKRIADAVIEARNGWSSQRLFKKRNDEGDAS